MDLSQFEGGYKKLFNVSEFNYGYRGTINQTPTTPLFVAEDNPSGGYFSPGVGIRIPLDSFCNCFIPDALLVDVSGNFFASNETTNYSFTGISVAFTTPVSAVGLGNSTLQGTFDRKYRFDTVNLDILCSYIFSIKNYPFTIEPIVSYAYHRWETTNDIFALFSGNSVSTYQKVVTHYNDIGGGITAGFPLLKHLNVYMKNVFYCSIVNSHLNTIMGINAPPSTMSTRIHNINSCSWAYKGAIGIDLYYSRFHLGVITNYEYQGFNSRIQNFPQPNPLQPFTPLLHGDGSLSIVSIGGYGGITF